MALRGSKYNGESRQKRQDTELRNKRLLTESLHMECWRPDLQIPPKWCKVSSLKELSDPH